MDNEATVRITGDASGVTPAANKAKSEVEGLATAVKASSEGMSRSFESVSTSINVMGLRVRESIGAFGEMREAAMAVGEALIAAFAVEQIAEFAKRMGEAAEKTTHLAETFGMSIGQMQQLEAVGKASGVGIDAITRGLGAMDRNLANAAHGSGAASETFKQLGISINDGKSQMEKLMIVADKFKNMDDGPKKVAMSMLAFSKSGKDLIPILNMGSEAIAEINRKSEEYGAVNEQAVAKGMALAESMNESKIAMQGVSNVLTDALAPMLKTATDDLNLMIKAFIDSYREGGTVKQVFDVIVAAGVILQQAFEAIGAVVEAMWAIVVSVFDAMANVVASLFGQKIPEDGKSTISVLHAIELGFVATKDAIIDFCAKVQAGITVLMDVLKMFARIADDAMHLNWAGIEADWKSGLAAITSDVESAAAKIKAAGREMQTAMWMVQHGGGPTDSTWFSGGSGGVPSPKGGAGGDFNPSFGGAKKPKKPKKQADTTLQEWRSELADMLADETKFGQDDLAVSLKFWEDKLALHQVKGKEELEIRRQIATLKLGLLKREYSDEVANMKAIEAQRLDLAKTEVELTKMSVQESLDALAAEESNGEISATRAAERRAKLNQELLRLDTTLENQEFEIKRKALDDEIMLRGTTEEKKRQLRQQEEVLTQQHLNKLVQLNSKADQQMQRDNQAIYTAQTQNMRTLAQGWAQNLARMATLQQGFIGTVKGLWQSLVGVLEGVLTQIIAKWIAAQLIKIGLLKVEHAATVGSESSKAGAGGVASMAAAPFPLNLTAPAFGASMAAAAMAFGAVGFAAEGGYDVPAWAGGGIDGRGGQVGIVHPREMVLPADIADNFRNGGGGSAVHIHVSAMDARSFRNFAMDNKGAFAEAIRKYARDGGR